MPRSVYQRSRSSIQYSCHFAVSAGGTKNSISICSNSKVRKMKLPGVISFRNDLPIWAIPNGGFLRENWRTFLKLMKMPWAVSGRRYALFDSSCTGPTKVSNIRLNWRGSESSPPQTGQRISPSASSEPSCSSRRSSSRKRCLHSPRHWTSGSVKPARCPDASQTFGFWMIAESSATMSSRSWSIARHHSLLTLFLSSTP